MAIEKIVHLTCHPAVNASAVGAIEVRVRRAPDATLSLRYRLAGDVGRLRIPAPTPPRAADRLWEHTCFEAFVGLSGELAYHEVNLSPSGEWGVFSFRDTRDGEFVRDERLAPRIEVRRADRELELESTVALGRLNEAYYGAHLRVGLSAVVEASDATRSYWAIHHPVSQPDFHHAEAFALLLEAPA